jgi:type I site-specific restriction-modification system R (restriction) subunit
MHVATKLTSLKTVAKNLVVSYNYLLDFIRIHEDLNEAMKPYRNEDNKAKNKKLLPPSVINLIYQKFG